MKTLSLTDKILHGTLSAWFICIAGAALVTAILYPAIRSVVLMLSHYQTNRRLQETVKRRLASGNGAIRVRQTDLAEKMTALDKQKFAHAESLLAAGRVVEAAQILEAIKFQRRAIDELEKAGFIDEACGVLIRLKVPNRAAVLCDRNKLYDKAAHYYLEAGDHHNAGRMFEKLAESDYRQLQHAADAFFRAGKTQEGLEALSNLLHTDKIVAICLQTNHLKFLGYYMQLPAMIKLAFPLIPRDQLSALCGALGKTPRAMNILAQWIIVPAAAPAVPAILEHALGNLDLAREFVTHLPPGVSKQLPKIAADLHLNERLRSNLDLALSAVRRSA